MCEGAVYYRLQLNVANNVYLGGECDIGKISNAEENEGLNFRNGANSPQQPYTVPLRRRC